MPYHTHNIAALTASRICHDLISPIGAVANGMELMQFAGASDGPEMALVSESAAHAKARIRFFRLTFGIASEAQMVSAEEVNEILRAIYDGTRIEVESTLSTSLPRAMAQAVLLAVLCAEHGLGVGGQLRVQEQGAHWQIEAQSPRLRADPALWGSLTGQPIPPDIAPAAVQFLLLPLILSDLGRTCACSLTEDCARITL
jgi:histidine phosphotransferase ChpT